MEKNEITGLIILKENGKGERKENKTDRTNRKPAEKWGL